MRQVRPAIAELLEGRGWISSIRGVLGCLGDGLKVARFFFFFEIRGIWIVYEYV